MNCTNSKIKKDGRGKKKKEQNKTRTRPLHKNETHPLITALNFQQRIPRFSSFFFLGRFEESGKDDVW
jgi:hypothetical protein